MNIIHLMCAIDAIYAINVSDIIYVLSLQPNALIIAPQFLIIQEAEPQRLILANIVMHTSSILNVYANQGCVFLIFNKCNVPNSN